MHFVHLPSITLVVVFTTTFMYSMYIQVSAVKLSREDISVGHLVPSDIDATFGEDIYLKITQPFAGQIECSYRSPGRRTDVIISTSLHDGNGRYDQLNVISVRFSFTFSHLDKCRITQWKDVQCGLRIENVTMDDAGGWRLTATDGHIMARGLAWVTVKSILNRYCNPICVINCVHLTQIFRRQPKLVSIRC